MEDKQYNNVMTWRDQFMHDAKEMRKMVVTRRAERGSCGRGREIWLPTGGAKELYPSDELSSS